MTTDLQQAENYLGSIDLSGTPRGLVHQSAESEASEVFDKAKAQAQIVGSGLLTFCEGVEAETREAISDSALLAQLVANKRADPAADPLRWFTEYSGVLQNVGWTLQEGSWDDYSATGTAADVSEKIIELLPVVLGPAAAALTIVTTAVSALRAMNPSSSWITIFSRETQKAKLARFQVGLVEGDARQVQVSLLACLIEAQKTITQVLFFRFKAERASFRACTNKVTLNPQALKDLAQPIRAKVRAYQLDYLSSIKDI